MGLDLRRTIVHATAALALAGSSFGLASPAAEAAPSARPTVGTCYQMTVKQVAYQANTAPVVDCGTSHTARTFFVFQAPDSVSMQDNAALGRVAANRCHPVYAKVVGSTLLNRALTTYSYAFFKPTKSAIADGDRSIECTVLLHGGRLHLAPLPTDSRPALHGRPPYGDTVRRCLEQTSRGSYDTTCDRPHAFRSTTDFTMPGKRYPSRRAFVRAANAHCGSNATYDVHPTAEQWAAGARIVVCYRKTTR